MSEIEEGSKAIQEISKAMGKGFDLTKSLGSFVGQFIEGSFEQATGLIEDKLKYARAKNQLNMMLKFEKLMNENNLELPNKKISLKLAVPLFQGAIYEDEDELQDMWAHLLINSSYEELNFDLKQMYIEVLKSLNPLDAKILETIYRIPYDEAIHKSISTIELPNKATLLIKEKTNDAEPNDDIKLSLLNLDRLKCISIRKTWGGGEYFGQINQTLLGKLFIEGCLKIKK